MKKQPAGHRQAGSGHEMVLLICTLSSSVHCLGSSAEHGASTGWGSGGDARQGWLGSVRAPLSSGSPLQAKEKLGLMSTTTFSHQPGEQVPKALPQRAAPAAQPSCSGQTLAGPAALVGCEDNGTRRGADVGRWRSEKGWSEDWGLEEGGGSRWSQGEGSGHGADSGGGERARQETSCQGFGEVLLQSQLGLQGERRRHREIVEQVGGITSATNCECAAEALTSYPYAGLHRNRLKTHHHSSSSLRGEAELW